MIEDIKRPDVGGVLPKMHAIAELAKTVLSAPFLKITTDDNLCSCVDIVGSFDAKETWSNGIFENSRYFRLAIMPQGRYYTEGENVSVLLNSGKVKFRKYTGTPESCIGKVRKWLEDNKS